MHIGQKNIGLCEISHFIKQPCKGACLHEERARNALKLLKQCCTLAKKTEN